MFLILIAILGCGSTNESLPVNIDFTNTIIFAVDTIKNKDNSPQLFAVKVDSPYTLTQLTNTKYPLSNPKWLPNGSSIIFLSRKFDNYEDKFIGWADYPDIYSMDTTGANLIIRSWHNLTKKEKKEYYEKLFGYIWEIAPLGLNKVIYTVSGRCFIIQDINKDKISLSYVSADSLGLSTILEFSPSPNGEKVAFVSRSKEEEFPWPRGDSVDLTKYKLSFEEISVMNINGKDYKRLTRNDVPDGNPCFSKDGKSIYFDRYLKWDLIKGCLYKRDIFVKNIDGTGEKNLTNSPETDDYLPEVSPDGELIAYVSKRDKESTEIWIMDSDGLNKHKILTLPVRWITDQLSWTPKKL